MSALLAVETSGSLCSLAIHVDGRWFEDTQNVHRLHNQVVLERLEALTGTAGVPRSGFASVAFGAGPGSFTGIRIAAAVAQGVAYASGGVVVPVRSALALALAGSRHAAAPPGTTRWITSTRSRRDAYYLAGYRQREGGVLEQTLEDHLHHGTGPPEGFPDVGCGVGDRPPWWPEDRPFLEAAQVTARLIGELALVALEARHGLPPAAAIPVYVSGDSPWRPMAG